MNRGHIHTLVLALLTSVAGCGGHGAGTGDPDAAGGGDDVDAPPAHSDASIDASDDPGGPAAFAAQPTSLGFGTQMVNTQSAPMGVTITNTGGTVSAPITANIQPGSFGIVSNGCTQGLRPAGMCVIQVRFQPQTLGQKMNMLVVSDGAASVTVPLSGTSVQDNGGGNAMLRIQPTTLDFGQVPVGTTTNSSLTVSNVGNASTGTLNLAKTGQADFALGTTTCGGALPPGGTCSINVTFTPAVAGQRAGGVTVASSAGGSVSSTLAGVGVAVQNGGLMFVPSQFNFGDVHVGDTSVAKQFSLVNNGSSTVGPILIAKFGANSGDFSITGNNCANQSLGAGGSCTFLVTFEPGFIGTRTAQLRAGTGTTSGSASADLSGNGTATAQ